MSELLFKDDRWTKSSLPSGWKDTIDEYADSIGLNVGDFNELLNNVENNGIKDKIDRDKRLGDNLNVTGTPTWMVNGKKLDSIVADDIRAAIEAALQEAEGNSDESADATNES